MLAERHLRELRDDSGIPEQLIAERGYRTVTDPGELLALGFDDYQARTPCLLVPLHGVDRSNGRYAIKPDSPRIRDAKLVKYDFQPGQKPIIDVPVRCLPTIADATVPLYLTEGAKKADCLAGLGCCALDLWGVHNWYANPEHGGFATIEPLEDWEHIPLDGRYVYLGFDSDAWSPSKPSVGLAMRRLANFLSRRGAIVFVVKLPDAEDGSKQGVDDYIARRGAEAFRQLVERAQPWLWGVADRVRAIYRENRQLRRELHALECLRRDTSIDSAVLRVSWAMADELRVARRAKPEGPIETSRPAIAAQAGVSPATVGKCWKALDQVPGSPIVRTTRWRGRDQKVTFITERQPKATAADILEAFASGSAPTRTPHGGARPKQPHCPHHLDAEFVNWSRDAHFNCGCVVAEQDVVFVEADGEVNAQVALLLTEEDPRGGDDPGHDRRDLGRDRARRGRTIRRADARPAGGHDAEPVLVRHRRTGRADSGGEVVRDVGRRDTPAAAAGVERVGGDAAGGNDQTCGGADPGGGNRPGAHGRASATAAVETWLARRRPGQVRDGREPQGDDRHRGVNEQVALLLYGGPGSPSLVNEDEQVGRLLPTEGGP